MKRRTIQAYACAVLGVFLSGMLGFLWGRGSLIIAKQTMDILKEDAYFGTTAEDLDRAAVQGMLESLSDPMATYLTKQNMESFASHLQGEKTIGIGIELVRTVQGFYVSAVQENSPAQVGGIARGDVIVAINGMRVDKGAVWPILEQDEKVELTISRNGTQRTQNVFASAVDPFPDVEQTMISDTIGYIRIRSFTQQGMETLVVNALKDTLKKGSAILDLRHNPGGRLDAALAIAQVFVPKGQALLTLNESGNRKEVYRSGDGSLSAKRIIILVDEQSASASEVLAGILQDYGKATVIGTKTYGKGTVQRVAALKNGGGIRFTVAEYILPSGAQINGKGLTPDKVTPGEEIPGWAVAQSRDEMLQLAVQEIKQSSSMLP